MIYLSRLPSDPLESKWPREGQISITDLEVKYASKSNPVIKIFSGNINGGEKIGVVGRTGPGKSTLMSALFRIVESSNGSVRIDGLDVYRIDQELWTALELVGLKDYVSELPEKLDAPVAKRGENFSVGQRQLMMLACAICYKPKILAADLLIQSSIRTHFKGTTVISIAHRVNTIADFDRIMVLDAGELVEFDSPLNLLHTDGSLFKTLVDAIGSANAAMIAEIVKKHSISY
ncbi:Multidrug resistance-associated protein 4 [Physocladia obscura]|uniref:Multidrug resistance-associated protein 4 n=1 Tax=Physocladia obscura TaxID=109957 RepID=A0AAD5SQL0_9FUNG|nr:Multidrug resistance-associated protein 4 [Physocladia obscura]